jgi:hypothetical protein
VLGAAAAAALRAWLGLRGRVVLCRSADQAKELAVQAARARTGREVVLALDPIEGRPGSAMPLPRAHAAARLAKADVAAVLFEPRVEDDAHADELEGIVAAARQHGTRVIADETRTAGRVHAGSSTRALGLPCEAVVVGEAVACGLGCAAVLDSEDDAAVELVEPLPDALALALAAATARALARQPVHEEMAAHGARLREAFTAAAAAEQIAAELVGPAALMRVQVAAQEGVAAPLLRWHLAAEMQRLGVEANEWLVAHALSPAVADAMAAALRGTMARARTLLIESNSYLSGGLPYVFATANEFLRERGLARYRYPKLADVEVSAVHGRMRIAFAAGALGPVTSSGFFVPTRLRGDFTVEAEYELVRWTSGPDAVCFGLFFQNELSTGRYYAQRTIASSGSDTVHGSFDGVLTAARRAGARRGALRLARERSRVTAWHRDEGGEWHELGTTDSATTDDGILGAKVWAKVACDGIVAEVTALTIVAEWVPDQAPPVTARPDPRRR